MKIIKDFENYSIDVKGNVYNNKTKRPIKAHLNKQTGYLQIKLHKDKKSYSKRIHRLLAEAYIPNPNNLSYIDHIDNNKTNNDINNLRWVLPKENYELAVEDGLTTPINKQVFSHASCENHGRTKLSNIDVINIRKLAKLGVSRKELGELYNKSYSRITDIVNYKTWKNI
jgi:hypothetical protein